MTNEEILHLFETTNITLARLSQRSGKGVDDLKKIIMTAPPKKGVRGSP
mgnify:CR=1 FL=1